MNHTIERIEMVLKKHFSGLNIKKLESENLYTVNVWNGLNGKFTGDNIEYCSFKFNPDLFFKYSFGIYRVHTRPAPFNLSGSDLLISITDVLLDSKKRDIITDYRG